MHAFAADFQIDQAAGEEGVVADLLGIEPQPRTAREQAILGIDFPQFRREMRGLPERGGAGLVLATSDLGAAATAVGNSGVRTEGAVCVAPQAANGTLLIFVKA